MVVKTSAPVTPRVALSKSSTFNRYCRLLRNDKISPHSGHIGINRWAARVCQPHTRRKSNEGRWRRLAHSTTNGASSTGGKASLKTMDIDGVTFVAADQAMDFLLDKDPEAIMQSGTVKALQQKLNQVQGELKEKLSENTELRKKALDVEKKSREQTSEHQDAKEELAALRTKLTKASEDLSKAQATAKNAVEDARLAVTNEFSQKYLETKDKQLAKMYQSVRVSTARVEEAEASAAEKVRAAESALLEAAMKAAERVNADASEAIALARGRVEVAESSSKSAQQAAKRAQEAQMETVEVAEKLFAEAAKATDRAAAAQGEATALQGEVTKLRSEMVKVIQQRDVSLKEAAERQARAVRTVRTAHEMCEHRVQEAQNEFERLKLAERDGARRARDDTERLSGRCNQLEERERELLRNQGSLQEALAQVASRAEAAEEKLAKRAEQLKQEHDEMVSVLKTNAAASLEVAKAEAMETAQQHARKMMDEASKERESVIQAAVVEKSNFEKLLASVNEELEYWRSRARRTEVACNTLQSDVMSLAKMLPNDMASMQLAVEGKVARTLIERSSKGMDEIVALDEEWLPPLDDSEASTA